MLSTVKKIFSSSPYTYEAHAAYNALVNQARSPWFYARQNVPDTVDGRFDLIVLHLFLLANRLQQDVSTQTSEFVRVLSEVFFADMDRSLREMGSTDTGTGKRVNAMAQAFYGRLQTYEKHIGNPQAMKESLRRNLYRESDAVEDAQLDALMAYVERNRDHLHTQSLDDLLAGKASFVS
ncbi:MAG: ubiquinol-cytochrome C chaperone family protein [Alphaproteobacteria bacterium]